MVSNWYDLLVYIRDHNGSLSIPRDPQSSLGIDQDIFDEYINELLSRGYITRYIRSYGITPNGTEFLNNN